MNVLPRLSITKYRMQMLTSSRQYKSPVFFCAGVPLAVTGLLWWSSAYEVSLLQAFAAFILAWIPWASYRRWNRGDRREIPLSALITGMFWLAYAVPLFLGSHDMGLVGGTHHLSEDSLSGPLCLAVGGVVALLAGVRIARWSRWVPAISLDVSNSPSRWKYLRVVLVSGILLRIFVPIDALGPEARQVFSNLENILPAVTFAILFRHVLRGKSSDLDRFLVLAYVFIVLALGLSSGWLGSFVALGLICGAIYVNEYRKLPLMALLIILPLILFFQPAKSEFRSRFWRSDSSASHLERITFWVNRSFGMWKTVIADPSGEGARDLVDNTLSRFSLLQQTANVMELTPEVVPYQYGRLYSYVAVTLIPRFVWPEKPSVSDANRWYQVSYRLTSPRELGGVSIGAGMLAESYINFGWFGPLLVMLPLGVFLELFNTTFLRHTSGLLSNSLGVVLLPGLIGIEAQLALYVAGLAQQVAIVLVVLVPELDFRHRRKFGNGTLAQRVYPVPADPSARLKARALSRVHP